MDVKVDFLSGIPIYEQIAQQVGELIQRGELLPGNQLPTVRRLAVQLGVNFNTVARAYRYLDLAGVISTQHGRGTFVLEQEQQEGKAVRQKIEDLTRFYLQKAARLGFTPEEIRECLETIVQKRQGDRPH